MSSSQVSVAFAGSCQCPQLLTHKPVLRVAKPKACGTEGATGAKPPSSDPAHRVRINHRHRALRASGHTPARVGQRLSTSQLDPARIQHPEGHRIYYREKKGKQVSVRTFCLADLKTFFKIVMAYRCPWALHWMPKGAPRIYQAGSCHWEEEGSPAPLVCIVHVFATLVSHPGNDGPTVNAILVPGVQTSSVAVSSLSSCFLSPLRNPLVSRLPKPRASYTVALLMNSSGAP